MSLLSKGLNIKNMGKIKSFRKLRIMAQELKPQQLDKITVLATAGAVGKTTPDKMPRMVYKAEIRPYKSHYRALKKIYVRQGLLGVFHYFQQNKKHENPPVQ